MATMILVPDQCAEPVLVRLELARISSSGRSNDGGTTVTDVEPIFCVLIGAAASPDDVHEPRGTCNHTSGWSPTKGFDHVVARECKRDRCLLGEVDGDVESVLHLPVHLHDERHVLDGEQRLVDLWPGALVDIRRTGAGPRRNRDA